MTSSNRPAGLSLYSLLPELGGQQGGFRREKHGSSAQSMPVELHQGKVVKGQGEGGDLELNVPGQESRTLVSYLTVAVGKALPLPEQQSAMAFFQ